MKKILTTLLLIISLFSHAQVPVNDNCNTATNLGTLPLPAACPSGIGAPVNVVGTNINATAPNPYTTLLGCQTAGNQPGPALDVWYSFVASGNIATIVITPGAAPLLANPAITLWRGTCAGLIGVNCANNGTAGGNITAVFQPLTPGQTYFIQISGMNNITSGNFNLSVSASNDCNNCLQNSNLTVNPLPVNGTYAPGTTVNFCYNITAYTQVSANWLHGVIPTFGCGWDLTTLTTAPPASCGGSGTWGWYNTWTSTANASVWGPGFAFNYTLPADANPGNNFGDLCSTPNWNFCWSVKTKVNCAGCTNLNVSINTTGDGESGSWTSVACLGDPNYQFAAVMSCCTTTAAVTHVSCFGGANGSATATPSGVGPFTYTWTTAPVQNTQIATGLPAGVYTVTSKDNNNCISTAVVTITQSPIINLPISQTNILCFGGVGSATANPSGGVGPYTYTWTTAPVQNTQVANNLPAGTYSVTITDTKGCTKTNSITITQPPVIAIGTLTNAATCSQLNGSAIASPIGGVGPYTYTWNSVPVQNTQAANNLGAGNYTVTVKDANNCIMTASVTISSTGSITTTAASTNVSCFGGANGSATATPLGGGPYTYTWNSVPVQNTQVATNLPAGIYTVTVNSLGCLATATVNITQPPILNATTVQTNVVCFGGNTGSASVTATGGTPAYTYSWNTAPVQTAATATALVAGTYSCTITDSKGCTKVVSVIITQPTQVIVTMSMVPTTCGLPNGSATASPAGGVGPYTYLWSNGQTTQTAINLLSGIYTVTVTSVGGCTTTANINVPNTGAPTVTIPIKVNVLCFGGNNGSANSLVVGGVGPFTYTWNTIPVQNTPNATNLTAGNYTLTVTGSNGCSSTATVNITQPTTLTATSIQTNVSCFNGNNGVAVVNPIGGVPPYTYLWSNAQTTQTATTLVAGNYTCVVTGVGGCTTSVVVNITQPPILAISMTSNSVSCFGGNNGSASVVVLGGTPAYTYTWNTFPVQNTTSANNLIAGNYTCTVTDSKGCQITSSVNIIQPTLLVVTTSMVPTTCGLPNGSATSNPSGGTVPYSYLWSNTQTTQTINNILAGVYTCTITDGNGCTKVGTVTVTNTGAPVVTIPTHINVSCFGGSNGSANSLVVGGVPPYTYLWSNAQITANATNLTAGNYTLTVTGNNGCSASATVNITQPTQLTGAITTTNVSCFGGNNGSAIATPAGGVGPYTYLWSNAQVTQTANNLLLGIYTCTITDLNGCQITVAANITQPTLLTLAIASQTNPSCFGGTNGALSVTGAGGTGLYLYSLNNGPNQVSSTFNNLTAGTYTIKATDANGCIATTTVTLIEPTALTITGNVTWVTCFNACDGELLANVGGGTPGYTYLWSNAATTNPATGLCAANYSVLVTDANGCQIAMTFILGQPNLLTVNTSGSPTSVCIGQQSTLNSNVSGGTPAYTYNWSNGGSNSNTTVGPTVTTTYSVQITDANGCTATSSVVISVNPPLSVNALISPSAICAGKSTTLTASGSGGNGGPYTYMWSPGGAGQSIVVTPSVTTIYTVTLSDGCSPTVTAMVTSVVNPLPVVTFTTSKLTGCEPLIVTFNNTTPGITSCNWTMNPYNGGMIGCNTSHTFATGNYNVSLSVTDANGCSATSSSVMINVYTVPVASFSANPTTTDIDNSSVQFTNLSTPGANMWSFGDGGTSILTNPSHTYNSIGYYNVQLTVTTFAGCQAIANGIIHIKDIYSFWVPNAFTPNDSGVNDYFYPVVMGYKSYTMLIFNRWGEQIYSGTQEGKWDGTYKNERVKDDVYVWKIDVIDLDGVHHEYVGHVTIIK